MMVEREAEQKREAGGERVPTLVGEIRSQAAMATCEARDAAVNAAWAAGFAR